MLLEILHFVCSITNKKALYMAEITKENIEFSCLQKSSSIGIHTRHKRCIYFPLIKIIKPSIWKSSYGLHVTFLLVMVLLSNAHNFL